MSPCFEYPKAASFGRVVPKSKIYEHAGATARLRQLFVDQVDQITWRYKLAPETINLPASKNVAEIQIFRVGLRSRNLSEEVLLAIDRAIPFPIIYELACNGNLKTIAAFKRPSASDRRKWVVSAYFAGDWEAEDKPRQPFPTAVNLGGLYDKLLAALIPSDIGAFEPMEARVERLEAIRVKEREIVRIKQQLARETQFNKKVAINAELREAMNNLDFLKSYRSEEK